MAGAVGRAEPDHPIISDIRLWRSALPKRTPAPRKIPAVTDSHEATAAPAAPAAERPAYEIPATGPDGLPPANFYDHFAMTLANILDDYASIAWYYQLVERCRRREISPQLPRDRVVRMLLDKAAKLAAARAPEGPIQNPAAVFVNWTKLLATKSKSAGRLRAGAYDAAPGQAPRASPR